MSQSSRGWLNIKVLLAAILFAVIVFAIFVWILWSAKADTNAAIPATAMLNIILAPTQTPPQPESTITPTPEPTSSQGTPQPSTDIEVGDYVQVTGTEGDGLRLHASAGLSSKVDYLAIEAEVFRVKEGPIDTDGYIWWLLEDPYTNKIAGWGASNYLRVVPTP